MKLAVRKPREPRPAERPPADHHLRGALVAIVALLVAFLAMSVFKLHGG